MTDEIPHHPVRLWVSEHDGWEAWVAEHDDGTFTAWAGHPPDYFPALYNEDSFEHACKRALFELARLNHHQTCGPGCTGWYERDLPEH